MTTCPTCTLLADAIVQIGKAIGAVSGGDALTGPQVLLLAGAIEDAVRSHQPDESP